MEAKVRIVDPELGGERRVGKVTTANTIETNLDFC